MHKNYADIALNVAKLLVVWDTNMPQGQIFYFWNSNIVAWAKKTVETYARLDTQKYSWISPYVSKSSLNKIRKEMLNE